MQPSVCVVGGGIAGAGAAYALDDAAVTVLESRSVGGRLASRRREGCVYDYGADHLRLADDALREVVTDAAGETLVEIEDPIRQFDSTGTITERPDDFARYSGREGIDGIVWALLEAADATVEEGATVTEMTRRNEQWLVTVAGDRRQFDAVVLATPSPATAVLLEGADWDADVRTTMARVAERVPSRTLDVVALHYPFEWDADYYGLVSVDRASDVVWLAREGCKPGHVPDGESLLVVHLGALWSAANAGTRPRETAIEAAHYAARLLADDRLREPDWWDHHRWARVTPSESIGPDLHERALADELAVAGDWVAGTGQAHAALSNGLEAGRSLGARLDDR